MKANNKETIFKLGSIRTIIYGTRGKNEIVKLNDSFYSKMDK